MRSLQQFSALSNIISHEYHPLLSFVKVLLFSHCKYATGKILHTTLQFVLYSQYRKSCEMRQQVLNVQFSVTNSKAFLDEKYENTPYVYERRKLGPRHLSFPTRKYMKLLIFVARPCEETFAD